MVEIISMQNYLDTTYTTNCQCGAKLKFKRSDVLKEKHEVYYANEKETGKEDYYRNYIICPNCGEILYEDETFFSEENKYYTEWE